MPDDKTCRETSDYLVALECALDRMELGSALPFADGVRDWLKEKAEDNFKNNHGAWKDFADTVLRAARQIGEYAEEFARFEAEIKGQKPVEVSQLHAKHAVAVVRDLCPAAPKGLRFKWCPEP